MIFQNAELFNVAQMIPTSLGYRFCRLPEDVRLQMNPRTREGAAFSCDGVEIRFVLLGESATVRFNMPDLGNNACAPIVLYFGSTQGGWLPWLSMKNLHQGVNEIVVTRPQQEERLLARAKTYHQPFAPTVMRLRLSSQQYYLLSIEGDIRPPKPEECPKLRGIFYGSSITHGSLSLMPHQNFAALCADALNADIFNMGQAGACQLDYPFSDYLSARKEYDFLCVELATNIVGSVPLEEFEKRIDYLVGKVRETHPKMPIVLIDVLSLSPEWEGYRTCVQAYIAKKKDARLFGVCGTDLIGDETFLSADFVHPSTNGQCRIATHLLPTLKKALQAANLA